MKFIHCSDIHLDSPMETNLSPTKARQRNAEICRTFERMADFAKQNHVTAVLICGDLFDARRAKASTIQFVLRVIESAENVDFLYLRGNHDQNTIKPDAPLPRNLKLFSEEWTYVRYNNVVIAGIEMTRENHTTLYDSLNLNQSDRNIVMLHGQVGVSAGYESISLPSLGKKHIDYLALGHLHSYQCAALDHRGTYCYSGCLEGRGFDECGAKGFVVLDVDEISINHRFVPCAGRTLHTRTTNITECKNSADILSAIRADIQGIPPQDLVKVTLTGTYAPDIQKDIGFLRNVLSPDYYSISLHDESRVYTEPKRRKHELSLKSEFINSVLDDKTLSSEEIENVLRLGLSALCGEELEL